MKIVFFGTSSFAARVLSYLLDYPFSIVAIVTRPDKPKGRSLQVLPSPVKEMAQVKAPLLPIYQPPKASTAEFAAELQKHNPDLFVVVAYGEIIKKNLLDIPPLGSINVHASLLPKYRGASPIQRALLQGEEKTGITIIEMALEMDAGDMLAQEEIPISLHTNFGELELALSTLASPLLAKVIEQKKQKTTTAVPQDSSFATFAPKLLPVEEEIQWHLPASQIHNQIRALSPFPGAWCWVTVGGVKKRLKIKKSFPLQESSSFPGVTLVFSKKEWIVGCGIGALRLEEVQLEGKKTLSIHQFLQGISEPPLLDFLPN